MGFPYRLYTPSAASLNHLHLVNKLRVRLENRYGQRMSWKGERQIRLEFEQLSEAERKRQHLTDADMTLDGTLLLRPLDNDQKPDL